MAGKDIKLKFVLQAVNNAGKALTSVARQLDSIERGSNEVTTASKKMGSSGVAEANKLGSSLQKTASAADKAGKSVKGMSSGVKAGAESFNKLDTAVDEVAKSADHASESLQKMGNEAEKAGDKGAKGMTKFQKGLKSADKLSNNLMTAGATIAAAGAGISLATLFPVKTAMDFQKAMNGVRAVTKSATGDAAKDFGMLEDKARELGATTQFTAKQAADAMVFLGRTGYDTKEVFDAVGPSLDLAAAGGLELAEAADIATNVAQGFGIEAENLDHVADTLAHTAASANTDIRMLGEAMSYAAKPAQKAGVSMEMAAAAIGVMGDAGIKSSSAGTALRAMLLSLTDPTDKARAALAKLHVQVAYNKDGTLAFAETMRRLRDAGMGLPEAAAIFRRTAASGALAVSDFVDKMESLAGESETMTGMAAKMREEMEKGLAGALVKLSSAFDGLMEKIGQPLLEPLEKFILWVRDVIDSIRNWVSENQELASSVFVVGAGIGAAMTILGTFLIALGVAIKLAVFAGKSFVTAANGIKTFAARLVMANASISGIGAALTWLGGVIAAAFAGWQIGRWIGGLEVAGLKVDEWVQIVYGKIDKFVTKAKLKYLTLKKVIKSLWGGDTTEIDREMKQLERELEIIDRTTESIKKQAAERKKVADEDPSEAAAKAAKEAGEAVRKAMEEATKATKDAGKAAKELAPDVEDSANDIKELGKATKDFYKQAEKAIKDLRKEAIEYGKSIDNIYIRQTDRRTALQDKIREIQRADKDEAAQRLDLLDQIEEKETLALNNIQALEKSGDDKHKKRAEEAIQAAEKYWDEYAKAAKLSTTKIVDKMYEFEDLRGQLDDAEVKWLSTMKKDAEEAAKSIEKIIEDLKAKAVVHVEADLKKAEEDINNLIGEMSEKVIRIKVKIIKPKASSSDGADVDDGDVDAEGMRRGGLLRAKGGRYLPGYGGGDRRLLLAEDGEYVVRKEAVKKYGLDLFKMLNNMVADVPSVTAAIKDNISRRLGGMVRAAESTRVGYQTGGAVASGPDLSDFGRVELDVGGRVFPVLGQRDVVDELKKTLRREKILRSN